MTAIRWFQHAFNGGAWAESAHGRSDLTAYASALRVCRNFIPRVAGSVAKRPGTLYIATKKLPLETGRLIPFIFNREFAYTIELGHQYARFYKNDDTQITSGGVPVEVATPWSRDELDELQWAQNADTLVLTHPDYQPRLLQRSSDTSWALSALDFRYGPYLSRNEVESDVLAFQTGTDFFAKLLSGASAQIDFRSNPQTVNVTADGSVFEAGRDEGRLLVMGDGRLSNPESFFVGTIATVNDVDDADVDFFDGRQDDSTPKATVNWWMQAYYESSSKSRWPAVCTFAQERLWLGGGRSGVDRIHGSRLGSLEDFDFWSYADVDPPDGSPGNTGANEDQHTILDTSGIQVTLSYPEVASLRWLRPLKRSLVAGTSRAVFVVTPPETEGFSPLVVLDASPTAAGGSHSLPAQGIDQRLHFVSASKRRVTRIGFDLRADAFVPVDLTQLNLEILLPGAVDLDVAYEPEPILWLATEDGRLVGCTIDEDSHVLAWHDHTLGGLGVDQDWAEVESVAVIPSPTGDYDQLWLLVRRTVGGSETRFVERMDARLEAGDGPEDQRGVDARGAVYAGVPVSTYSVGLHLIGETVDVLADGAAESPQVVDGAGQIALASPAASIVAGLPYVGRVRSLLPVLQSRQGLSIGERYRCAEVVLRLVRSAGGRVGVGPAERPSFRPIAYRLPQDPLGSPPPLFTGLLRLPAVGEAGLDFALELEHSGPTILELSLWGALPDVSDSAQ